MPSHLDAMIDYSGATIYNPSDNPSDHPSDATDPIQRDRFKKFRDNKQRESQEFTKKILDQVVGTINRYRIIQREAGVTTWVTYKTITDLSTCNVIPSFSYPFTLTWLIKVILYAVASQYALTQLTHLDVIYYIFRPVQLIYETSIPSGPIKSFVGYISAYWWYWWGWGGAAGSVGTVILSAQEGARILTSIFELIKRRWSKTKSIPIVVAELHFRVSKPVKNPHDVFWKNLGVNDSEYVIYIASLENFAQLTHVVQQEVENNEDAERPKRRPRTDAIGSLDLRLTIDTGKRTRDEQERHSDNPAVDQTFKPLPKPFPTMIGVGKKSLRYGGLRTLAKGFLANTEEMQQLRKNEWSIDDMSTLACHLSQLINLRQSNPKASLSTREGNGVSEHSNGSDSSEQFAVRSSGCTPLQVTTTAKGNYLLDRLLQTILNETYAFVLYQKQNGCWVSTIYWLQKNGVSSSPFAAKAPRTWISTSDYTLHVQDKCAHSKFENRRLSIKLEGDSNITISISTAKEEDANGATTSPRTTGVITIAENAVLTPFFRDIQEESVKELVVLSNSMNEQLKLVVEITTVPIFMQLDKSNPLPDNRIV